MILEAVASHDLWIRHAYFGMPGSNNDINVLPRCPVFSSYLRGRSTFVSFVVNGRTYNMGYYLADGIYTEWAAFVKTTRHPMEQKTRHFATNQESAPKDIERAFGASLEAHFPAGIPVVSPGRQPTRKFSARSLVCIFGSPLHGGLRPE